MIEAESDPDPMSAFKQKMLAGNYVAEGRAQAEQLAALATMSLTALPASEALNELYALAHQVIERDH